MSKKKAEEKPKISKDEELKIVLKSGKEFTFSHFQPKEQNQIKVNLNYEDAGDNGEGIWACISDEDFKAYENNETDDEMTRIALTRNQSIGGIPWGTYIPFRLLGKNRPVCRIIELDTNKTDFTFNQVNIKP